MAKFADIAAGPRARKRIKLPLPGAQPDPETGEWIAPEGTKLPELDVRPLREDEYEDVLAAALAEAKKGGQDKAEDGDVLFERAKMLHTLILACLDPDSSADAPEPFFRDVEQIRKSELMTPEVVGYLYLQQQAHQDEVSPLKKDLTPAEFFAACVATAGGNMAFFVNSRPGTQWSFLRTLASLHIASIGSASLSSQSSEPRQTPTSGTG